MKIYFNALGVITSTDTTDEPIRQGNVGNVIKAYFTDKNNALYTAKLNFTRPDGSKITKLTMLPDASVSTMFKYVLDDAWYLAIPGEASLTIYLYDANGNIAASGQVTFAIEQTDYDDDPASITDEQYDSLLALVTGKVDKKNAIVVVDDIDELSSEDLEQFEDGQLVYSSYHDHYFRYVEDHEEDEPAFEEVVLDEKRFLRRYLITGNELISSLASISNDHIVLFTRGEYDYLCRISIPNAKIRVYDLMGNVYERSGSYLEFSFNTVIALTYRKRYLVEQYNLSRIYGTDSGGNQTTIPYGTDVGNGKIVQRNSSGQVKVPLQPSANDDAASKKFVVDLIVDLERNAFILVDTTTCPTLEDMLEDLFGEEGYIYLYPIDTSDTSKGYYQYIWENDNWLSIGTTVIDLSDYYTISQIDDIINNVKANVPKHQLTTAFIIDALTNINNRTFVNYTSENVTISGYSGIKILKNGSKVTEQEAKEYMEYMTGSYYLPKYNYDKPKNTYFIKPDGTIYKPQYDDTNGLVLYEFGNIATKQYADTKVAKSSEHNKVYGTDNSGNQKLFDVDNTVGADGNIVRRASGTSQIMVPLTPIANGHASSKKYVDDSIANAISAVYRYKGTKTCAEINALTGQVVGDVYNVSDTGTLTVGNVSVNAGDNVAWTTDGGIGHWDKLADDIDWTQYNETFLAAGFIETSDVDSVPENLQFNDDGEIINDDWTGNMVIDYMSPPISDISIDAVPATLTFNLDNDYDNMITNADWTGIMTIEY